MVNYCPFNIHKLTSGFRPRLGMLRTKRELFTNWWRSVSCCYGRAVESSWYTEQTKI